MVMVYSLKFPGVAAAPGESYQSRKLKKERVYFYGNGLFIHNILAQLLILSLILITKRKA